MLILAHRAQDVKEPIPSRFGVEIDVRDAEGGTVYVGHDPLRGIDLGLTLEAWISKDLFCGSRPCYAINIKADGIEGQVSDAFKYHPDIWNRIFFFDGSFPTMRRLKNLYERVAERISEEEPYRGHSHIIWLDRWDWVDGEGAVLGGRPTTAPDKMCNVPLIDKQGRRTKIYAVSPELHIPNCQPSFRNYWWRRFQEMGCTGICTDHWLEAEGFLG